ncbi:hypothetical protein MTO96_004776 [Rhipicephalus appendiculatus]
MSTSSRNISLDTAAKTSRITWSERETMLLIDLWETHFDDLWRQKHNGAVYLEIARSLRASGYTKSKKQVHCKIDNMTQMYRKWRKQGGAESALPSWPFYWPIHRFMQKVKPTVIATSQGQGAVPMQSGEPVQQVTNKVFSEPAETEHLLPDIQTPPSDLICQPNVHLKEEPPDDDDASERTRGEQLESNDGITAPPRAPPRRQTGLKVQ